MKKNIQLIRAETFLLNHNKLFNISLILPLVLTTIMTSYFFYRDISFFNSLTYFIEIYFICLPLLVSLSISFSMKGEEAIGYQYLLSNVFSKKKKLITTSIAISTKLFLAAILSIIPLFVLNIVLGEINVTFYFVLILSILLSLLFYVQLFLFSTIYLNSTATIMLGGLSLLLTAIASLIVSNYLFLIIPWIWGPVFMGLLLQEVGVLSLFIFILMCTGIYLFLTYISIILIVRREC